MHTILSRRFLGRLYAIKGGSANILDKRSFDFKNPQCLWAILAMCVVCGLHVVTGEVRFSISLCYLSFRRSVPSSLAVPFAFVLIRHLYYSHRLQKILRIHLFLF